MRLRDFIANNKALITSEWERFAATQTPAAARMSRLALKDHIGEILSEILADMGSDQSAAQEEAKSKGEGPSSGTESAAETHAAGRAESGFTIEQLTAEFRALRASIIRLWTKDRDLADRADLNDLTRFNEAIDQALSESLVRYSADIEEARELFLGILGHDLRSPLQAVMGAAEVIAGENMQKHNALMAATIISSANRMQHLITDLVELTRVRLGDGILVQPKNVDVPTICGVVLREMRAIYRDRSFVLHAPRPVNIRGDAARFGQVLSNLVGNAVQHGDAQQPITITVDQSGTATTIAVHNAGTPIPAETLPRIFDAFVQGLEKRKNNNGNAASLGLGLYIAHQIVIAHGGEITVSSAADTGTTFLITLPAEA
ncbi:MAG: Sensor histidine kinase [Alphaproteobacteria bacterium]|jgi:signal transduction histidine kinase|nr:Sensor histidine kinase [Alphaproteobacteria bacterium]